MVQRPRPDLRGGCAAMRIPTATAGGGGCAPGNRRSYRDGSRTAADGRPRRAGSAAAGPSMSGVPERQRA